MYYTKIRILDLRENNDLIQNQLARYLSYDQSVYSRYKNGKIRVPISIIIELSKFYETCVDYMIGLTYKT